MPLILDPKDNPATRPRKSDATELHSRLRDVRQLESRRRWGTRVCSLVLTVLAVVIAIAGWDYFRPLGAAWRALGLLSILAAAVWGWRRAAGRCRYETSDAAADIEAAFPRYGQRLRTTLDYVERPSESAPAQPQLLRALGAETRQMALRDDLTQASSPRGLYLALGSCLLLAAVCGISLLCVPEWRIACGRVFLLPWYYTTVSLSPIQQPIPQGGNAVVEIDVQGRPIREATVCYRPAGTEGSWQLLPLLPQGLSAEQAPVEKTGKLSATIEDCRHDLEVLVLAGPQTHPVQRIMVLQPLELVRFAAHVQPPEYVHRDAEAVDVPSFVVWEGSRVALRFELSRAPAQARLEPKRLVSSTAAAGEQEAEVPPVALQVAGTVVTGELSDLRHSLQFTLDATAADRMTLDSPRFCIRVQLDKKPQIRFVSPDEDVEAIPTTEVPLVCEGSDDIAVTKAGVFYKIGDGSLQTLWEQEYGQTQNSLHAEKTLFLEDHALTYQDAVTYYAYAEDNYFGQPRRVTTELRFIDIRPFKRAYQILASPGGT